MLRPPNQTSFSLPMSGRTWHSGGSTWYGPPNGAGSDGGACGYGNAVETAPFSSMIAAGSPSLFRNGRGCGTCYQVKCNNHLCSRKPVTVVITDLCPGGPCFDEAAHFDLSGTAIGRMALPGRAEQLRGVGRVPIEYARVACEYPGRSVTFRVDLGSTPNYLSVLIEFEDGDGDLARVDLKETPRRRSDRSGGTWRRMMPSWGALWKLDAGGELRAPISIRLTSRYSGKTLVAKNVIPARWRPGAIYRSFVNYE
ncbi:Expansin-B18 [Acorus calamus]|uniref:Expansin-B18 n=1 Tax=Acorus calamus TaxID=4465 RepID=A0AAV9DRH8_ACOCL|nr:Expansin-B18 [Acorus calamus]